MRNLFILRVLFPLVITISLVLLIATMVEALLHPPVTGRTRATFKDRLLTVVAWPFLLFSTRGRSRMKKALTGL